MPIYMNILNYIFSDVTSQLKILLIGHFTLIALGAIGSFTPVVYLFYNLPVILLLFWSIIQDGKTLEPLRLVMAWELCSIIIDIIYLGAQISDLSRNIHISIAPFSILIAFVHWVSKPFVVLYLLKKNEAPKTPLADKIDNDPNDEVEEVVVDDNPFELPRKR